MICQIQPIVQEASYDVGPSCYLQPVSSSSWFLKKNQEDQELPVSHSEFLPAVYFTYGHVRASMFSQFVPSFPSNVSVSLFSMSASPYIRSVNSYSPIILGKNKYSYFHLRKLGQRMCT